MEIERKELLRFLILEIVTIILATTYCLLTNQAIKLIPMFILMIISTISLLIKNGIFLFFSNVGTISIIFFILNLMQGIFSLKLLIISSIFFIIAFYGISHLEELKESTN